MTRKEARDVVAALAFWEPQGTSCGLMQADRANLRHEAAIRVGAVVGIDAEQAITIVDSTRMSGDVRVGDPA